MLLTKIRSLNMIKKATLLVAFLFTFSIFLGVSWAATDQQAWVQETDSPLKFTYLEAIIHVKIKNNNDHVEYFKISQQYYQTTPAINWTLKWTSPAAVKMAKYINTDGDYGWPIQPGQTKEVSFKVVAQSPSGGSLAIEPAYIVRNGSIPNQFWPLLNEPGLTATWFFPNEIEYLNPNLDLQLWRGKFCFWIKNVDTTGPRVQGIVRAPIVPIDSKLVYSNPKVTYLDDELPWADTAAWDVTLYPGQQKHYSYTYQWPTGASSSSTGKYQSPSLSTDSKAQNTTVPTAGTGVPYALFAVGAIIVGSGVAYAKLFR
jgi:hypothetical protein